MRDWPDLLVLRHGQTDWNLAGRFQGRRNSDLTELGQAHAAQQSQILQPLLADYPYRFASPQGWAVHTARIALGDVPFAQDDRLQEVAFGDWEGLTRTEIRTQITGDYDDYHWLFQSPNGETFSDMCARVISFLDHLKGPSVIVTHGVTSVVIRGLWLGLSMEDLAVLPKEQGCVIQLKDGEENALRV
ncbi:histidine phosphatase family protein [Thalassobius sp. I31.1]|uniref:histidine phosphatase family protein n=1 Tax=Thalassobius sp. I31.1 TaxID=2109912 RepID=UPI000D1A2A3B|nr:histidine phosphatase family protein [Thalassobius sp. I31.1]